MLIFVYRLSVTKNKLKLIIKYKSMTKTTKKLELLKEGTNPNNTPTINSDVTFNVNKRFEFLEQLSQMVVENKTPSLLVTGEGGLGKTYTINQTVSKLIGDDGDVQREVEVIKGYSTARGLYNSLYDHNGKLIIFDDCDSILSDKVSLNILKGALDSYEERIITWQAQMRKGDEYPQKFEFTGRIIFISNKKREKIDQAILSRCMVVDVSMTPKEKIERMQTVLEFVCPEVPLEEKQESLDLINKHRDEIKDLNFRTLIKVSKIKNSFPDGWEDLATYSMFEG